MCVGDAASRNSGCLTVAGGSHVARSRLLFAERDTRSNAGPITSPPKCWWGHPSPSSRRRALTRLCRYFDRRLWMYGTHAGCRHAPGVACHFQSHFDCDEKVELDEEDFEAHPADVIPQQFAGRGSFWWYAHVTHFLLQVRCWWRPFFLSPREASAAADRRLLAPSKSPIRCATPPAPHVRPPLRDSLLLLLAPLHLSNVTGRLATPRAREGICRQQASEKAGQL